MKKYQQFENAFEEIKEITGCDSWLFDKKGQLIAGKKHENSVEGLVSKFLASEEKESFGNQFYLFAIEQGGEPEYVYAFGPAQQAEEKLARMAFAQVRSIVTMSEQALDKSAFLQNLLLGNLLSTDIYSRAKKLHIEPKERVAFVIESADKNNEMVQELVKNLSNLKSGDYVTDVDEHSLVLIKDISSLKEEEREEELAALASSLVDNIQMEAMTRVRVGYGSVVTEIPDMIKSYQEAKLALEVSRVFAAEKDTISYSRLGIGRLIYQLPMDLCQTYIKEVFGDHIPDILEDEEAMTTIRVFFENSLNIAETARQLYLHRNTLVYRLERIQKAVGLDIRTFEDAMTFRIAMMVIAHMKAKQ